METCNYRFLSWVQVDVLARLGDAELQHLEAAQRKAVLQVPLLKLPAAFLSSHPTHPYKHSPRQVSKCPVPPSAARIVQQMYPQIE